MVDAKAQTLDDLICRVQQAQPLSAAFVHPVSETALRSAMAAYEHKILHPVLIGSTEKIMAVARSLDLDAGVLKNFSYVDVPHSHAAAEKAAELVRTNKVQFIVKGASHTDELMGVLVDKAQKIRTDKRMSHVFVLDVESYPKLLMISDAALNVTPDLSIKRDIVQNSIDVAHALGIEQPKVAILSAQEQVKPQLSSTVDAACLCKMADRGQITGGIIDGPLAFDNAINLQSAQIKGIRSPVAGDADILITPDLESGNMLAKQLSYLADAKAAGIVMGARVPIVLTSRSESAMGRLYSMALAVLVAQYQKTCLEQKRSQPIIDKS